VDGIESLSVFVGLLRAKQSISSSHVMHWLFLEMSIWFIGFT